MGHTYGMFTNSQKGATFGKMKALIVDDNTNPNHPENPESPNAPRVDRYPGYQNPQLGDAGTGKIGRWQQLSLDALETVIEQIIEQYLKDRTWYSKVRCREALWNMYHRLEWWLKQQVDPSRNDYQRALQMIRDCINHILTEAQDNVSLPLCPVPYDMPFHGDYFNHYDGNDVEVKLFDSRDLPRSDDFPGLFRYVSSTEDQEWELVHSTGANELQGSETILKISMNRLLFGNSSKVTFNWRFKKRGFIRFKYLASTSAGNGLTFFINNNQVGGEWNRSTGWQEIKFNVQPGQTYKFDWMVRKQNEMPWGSEAIYIKDIECIEVIKSLEAPTPPDFDTLGREAYADPNYQWVTFSGSSVVRTHFDGVVTEYNRARRFSFDMNSECDGIVSFAYRMDARTPSLLREYYLMYSDDLYSRTQLGTGHHGSSVTKNHDGNWTGNGQWLETQQDAGKITYDLVVGADSTVDASGVLEIVCPTYEIDHYEPAIIQTIGDAPWYSGQWQYEGGTYVVNDPVAGMYDLSTNVNLTDDGWFTFGYDHDLRESESLQVLVDGDLAYYSVGGPKSDSATIPLAAGSHTITFRLEDNYTEQPIRDSIQKTYTYGKGGVGNTYTTVAPLGSRVAVTRNWPANGDAVETFSDGSTIKYDVTLNPGATFKLNEVIQFLPNPNHSDTSYSNAFIADFNTENNPQGVNFSSQWEWAKQVPTMPDGLYKVEGAAGDHTASVPVSLSNGGFVTFKYGGKYGTYDYLALRIGDTTIWQGSVSSGSEDTEVKVALPAGSYTLTWVYHCASGGSTETIPPDTQYPSEPSIDEVCYPASGGTTSLSYSQSSHQETNDRGSKIGWGGSNFYNSSTSHAAEKDGAVITRDITVSAIDHMAFTETLHVQAGKETRTHGVFPVDMTMSRYQQNAMIGGSSQIILNVTGEVKPGESSGWVSPPFYTDGQINVSFDYLLHLENKFPIEGARNSSGSSARHRAQFAFRIEDTYYNYPEVQWLTQDDIGKRQSMYALNDWTGCGEYNLSTKVPPGEYRVKFVILDLTTDYDMDDQGYYFYAAVRDIKASASYTKTTTSWDDTKVKVELIDKTTGQVVQTNSYSTNGAASKDFTINFQGLTAGKSYRVRYTLDKGAGTSGGLYGNGGSFNLTDGKVWENWNDYCVSNGKYYPAGDGLPPHPYDPGQTVEIPSTPGAWSFLDAIHVSSSHAPICYDTNFEYKIYDGGTVLDSRFYNNHSAAETMNLTVTNNDNVVKTYTVIETFYSTCGDGARLTKGGFTVDDAILPKPSYARITDYSATNNKPIWMGGCDASSITVSLMDEFGNIMQSQYFSGGGLHSFGVSDLAHQPYSKYRLVIETNQLGVVSTYTGKPYMTTFRLLDFKAYEAWENIPDPFNGKLEFFIDGQLMATYTDPGGFYNVSFPVTKGTHAYKWVFTELGNGNSYDVCEIDFFQLTNWICDKVRVVPYCEPGGGDKCVEELIKCLLKMWNDRPKACVIGKTVWLFT